MEKIDINNKDEVVKFLGSEEHWFFRGCIYNYLIEYKDRLGINNVKWVGKKQGIKEYYIKVIDNRIYNEYAAIKRIGRILKDELGAAAADTRYILDCFTVDNKDVVPNYIKDTIVNYKVLNDTFVICKDENRKYCYKLKSKCDGNNEVIKEMHNISEYEVAFEVMKMSGKKSINKDLRQLAIDNVMVLDNDNYKEINKNRFNGNDMEDYLLWKEGLI